MLKCDDCGETFHYADSIEEYRGEFWGAPAYERMACCPYCKSTEIYEEEEEEEE